MYRTIAASLAFLTAVRAQQVCTAQAETHPSLSWSKCTSSGCSSVSGSVVIDSNWRWTHSVNTTGTNCYTGNKWDATLCPDDATCAQNCCVDGAGSYQSTYGASTSGNALTLQFVTENSSGKNVGSRLFLMQDDDTYQTFTLLNNEFTFDVDVSTLGCGLNGALYFVSMDADGGKSKYSGNKAGAKYGVGYCDSQCPRDLKWIGGEGNVDGWVASSNDANSGVGGHGSCCSEMDIWEANSFSNALTPHPCKTVGQEICDGDGCGGTYSDTRYGGNCDPDGCDFNPWRQGNQTFFGPGSGFVVDTTQKVTVVTQFIESGGALSEIKRFYVQNGKTIANSASTVSGVTGNSITESFCKAQKTAFGDTDEFDTIGGFTQVNAAVSAPMVLVMSLWDDHYANMLWLDSTYPVSKTGAGASRGSCSTDSGAPGTIEETEASSHVIFSNIKFGPIGSTFSSGTTTGGGGSGTASSTSSSARTSATGTTVGHYGQCGGIGYSGSTTCASSYKCTYVNDYYSQCL